jgi:hypothetical protein
MTNEKTVENLVAELEERIRTAQLKLDAINGPGYDQWMDDHSCELETELEQEINEARNQLRKIVRRQKYEKYNSPIRQQRLTEYLERCETEDIVPECMADEHCICRECDPPSKPLPFETLSMVFAALKA